MENNELAIDDWRVRDILTLRFEGENEDGTDLHELRASHVAQTLLGLTEMAEDFEEAGAFHEDGPIETEILVKPAKEGSFFIEVMRFVTENPEAAQHLAYTAIGAPTLFQVVQWSVKATSDQVTDVDEMSDGNMKVTWRNGSVDVIPPSAWKELTRKHRRRRRQLRKIMAPLADQRVDDVEIVRPKEPSKQDEEENFVLTKADFAAANPVDEEETTSKVITVEGTIASLDFDDSTKWSIRVGDTRKKAEIVDSVFLEDVRKGMKVSNDEIYRMMIQEDRVIKNGRSNPPKWTVLHLKRKEAQGEHPTISDDRDERIDSEE